MPKRIVFDNAGERLYVTDDGDLFRHRSFDGEDCIVTSDELEEFSDWLAGEVVRLKATRGKAK